MKGRFFVIDGVDGSGKGTQCRMVYEKLKELGHDVLMVDFPRYGKKSAALVEEYLNGAFGSAAEVTPYQASIFYACDRFAASKEMNEHLAKGGIILSNRYVSSNQIHQAGKIKDVGELDRFLLWLDHLEYTVFAIPRPEKVIFLNMPFEKGRELVLKKEKEERTYLKDGKQRDLHEEDVDHLRDAYERACSLARKFDDWVEVRCELDGGIRSVEDINAEVMGIIENEIRKD